jgi:hypothetical protein
MSTLQDLIAAPLAPVVAAAPRRTVDVADVAAAVDRVLVDLSLRRYFEGLELREVRSTLERQARQYATTGAMDPTGPDGSLYRHQDLARFTAHFAAAIPSSA